MSTTIGHPILHIHEESDGWWRIVLDNGPLNMYDRDLQDQFSELITQMEENPHLKVVTIEPAHNEFFMAHIDLARISELSQEPGKTGLPPWPDFLVRMERAPVLTVGVLRGRARGVGSEFLLAMDVRFGSKEYGIISQPELGFGFFPGGGGLERLPLAVGRARALEAILGAEDFDADTAAAYGWLNRSLPDAELNEFVARFARRVSSFDKAAITATKEIMNNRVRMADPADLVDTQHRFDELVAGPVVGQHLMRFFELGGQQPGDLESNLGDRLTELSPTTHSPT